ncbi:hypothetical protein G9464_20810 [Halostella sp. JP-L12]|uniref:hypothetical protein n=1 Tax=Halostella TaxID=1843185 RepID=UPI0013CF2AFD|nr:MULTISPECIES: hypothetical protein [Halostella]NHN50013.1 hypothetical protein [Halostella sp. JP-L12]
MSGLAAVVRDMNPNNLLAIPEISRTPKRAIPVVVFFHAIADLVTAYWMMDTRGTAVEGNPLTVAVYNHGPEVYALFIVFAVALLGGLFWRWRHDLWSNEWTPVLVELFLIAGIAMTLGNAITALGYF